MTQNCWKPGTFQECSRLKAVDKDALDFRNDSAGTRKPKGFRFFQQIVSGRSYFFVRVDGHEMEVFLKCCFGRSEKESPLR